MKMPNRSVHLLTVFLFAAVYNYAAPTEEVLARFDRAASSFHSMSAQFRQISHTAVIDDDTEEHGTLVIHKAQEHDVRGVMEYVGADQRSCGIDRHRVQSYHPKTRSVQVYDLGKHGEQVVEFLLIGFGTSGKDLAANYHVRVVGEATVGLQKTTRLELIPKSADAQKYLTKVELWIPEGEGYPIQEKLYQPSGDYTPVSYSDVNINPPLPKDAFELKLPKDVKYEHPQRDEPAAKD